MKQKNTEVPVKKTKSTPKTPVKSMSKNRKEKTLESKPAQAEIQIAAKTKTKKASPKKAAPQKTESVSVPPAAKKTTTKTKRSPKVSLKKQTKQAPVIQTLVPEYQEPLFEEPTKVLSFSKLIGNETLLNALQTSSFCEPTEELNELLPAVMRGSHTMIYKSKQTEDILIGVLPALHRALEDVSEAQLSVLLFPTAEDVSIAKKLIVNLFQSLNTKLTTNLQEVDAKVLFLTPENFIEACQNKTLNPSLIKTASFYQFDDLASQKSKLKEALTLLKNAQLIFISYKNTPAVRELSFEFLDDPEIFSLLPRDITDQYPKQFCHALESTQKFQVLLGYIKTYKPRAALVVANSKTVAEWIAFKLHGNNIKASLLTSFFSSHEKKEEFLQKISSGEINIVVTTDFILKNFAAENFHCIYHFDLPEKPQLYIDRVNKLIGGRNPISIAFICEDYGYNMGKIQDLLGFKIRLTRPDKNFFNFKDESDYPLHSDGRVKAIGEKPESTPLQEFKEQKDLETKDYSQESDEQKIVIKPQKQRFEHTQQKPKDTKSRHHQPDASKFVRRDERAREAVADALLAAKQAEEKRNAQKTHQTQNETSHKTDTEHNVLGTFISVVFDSVKAGLHATRDAFSHNVEEKLPKLHKLFKRNKK